MVSAELLNSYNIKINAIRAFTYVNTSQHKMRTHFKSQAKTKISMNTGFHNEIFINRALWQM
jgi:hypothetical protein